MIELPGGINIRDSNTRIIKERKELISDFSANIAYIKKSDHITQPEQ